MRAIQFDEIEKRIKCALDDLLEYDSYLLEKDLNECSINHRIACHLQSYFSDWHVDCEYNKDADQIKQVDLPKDHVNWDDTESKSVFPDIIVHMRGGKGPNLIVIEVKKSSNRSDRKHDFNKLGEYGETLSYSYSLFLVVGTKENLGKFELMWFKKGDQAER